MLFKLSPTPFLIILGLLLIGGWFVWQNNKIASSLLPPGGDQPLYTLKIGEVTINVELADTPDKKTKGLSGKVELPENQGMLFLYDAPGFYSFWMKDMYFPIDTLWINKNLEVVYITKSVDPTSFPKIFQPPKPVQYVLEVNAGWANKNNIEVGDRVTLSE